MSETTTPTPRTDAIVKKSTGRNFHVIDKAVELAELCRTLELELSRASAPINQKLREALEFYADERRYNGANQRSFEGDKHLSPEHAPYMTDVTRDRGKLATEALTLLAPDTRTEWQPIATAPLVGLVDIWIEHSDGGGVRWANCYYDRICDEWRTTGSSGHLVSVRARAVKFWMPLPAAPSGKVVPHV